MENNVITISRNELKAEMRSALGEIIGEGAKSVGELLIATLGGSAIQEPTPEQSESEEVPIVEPPPKNELVKIMCGYLYMTLGEMNYKQKEIVPIIQRLEKIIANNDYETAMTAYCAAETTLTPIIIMGVIVPYEMYDMKISDLKYESPEIAVRFKNALELKKITKISDFHDYTEYAADLGRIRGIGEGRKEQFVRALKATIRALTNEMKVNDETAPTVTAHVISSTIEGIEIPPEYHNMSILSLKFTSKISRTKLSNALKEKGIIQIKDFFKPENAVFSKCGLSYGGRKTFLETLKRTIRS